MILYAYPFRSRAERVVWTLNELAFDYKVIRLDPFKGETATPDFLKLNPSKKVPVLVHGQKVLTESLAIMEYLNDISKHVKLIPSNPDEHYQYQNAMYYCVTEIESYLWIADQATRLKFKYHWPTGTKESCLERINSALPEIFEKLTHQPYITGDYFTLADIYYFQCLDWAKKWGITLPMKIEKYLNTLSERPAFPKEMLMK